MYLFIQHLYPNPNLNYKYFQVVKNVHLLDAEKHLIIALFLLWNWDVVFTELYDLIQQVSGEEKAPLPTVLLCV